MRDGKINILFVGRLEKRKGLKYLLSAYSKLKWDWPNLRLLVVGPGNLDIDSIRIISERNLKDLIFTGSVDDHDKARYYKSADIYCSPATGKESFGIVLLEAMASGLPIVASAIEGYSSVITDMHDGVLFEPKSEESLIKHIEKLLNDINLRNNLANNGLKTSKEFKWSIIAERVMKHYLKVLNNK